jgi:hypothetical protein
MTDIKVRSAFEHELIDRALLTNDKVQIRHMTRHAMGCLEDIKLFYDQHSIARFKKDLEHFITKASGKVERGLNLLIRHKNVSKEYLKIYQKRITCIKNLCCLMTKRKFPSQKRIMPNIRI